MSTETPREGALRRRTLLAAAAAAAVAAPVVLPAVAQAATPGTALAPIDPLPAGAPDRKLFAAAEQRYASYLAILPALVNDIDTGINPETYGHLAGGWSRTPTGPTNARVQEHVATMSWFYANQRPWNPYYRDAKLLVRLDAALFHYLRIQHADGSFPEYSGTEHGLSPTGFGIGYLAKTLANLRQANALPETRGKIGDALRKAMGWLLDPNNAIWTPPIEWTNQVMAGLAGCSVALQLLPDPTIRKKLNDRVAYMAANGQSPAGFFYDPRGMDINYNFEVMMPELAEYFVRTLSPVAVQMARRFSAWFGYNLLREPDNSGFFTYYAVSARTAAAAYDEVIGDDDRQTLGSRFIPVVPSLSAFYTAAEDKAAARAAWATESGPAPALAKLNTSPRIPAHAMYHETLPPKIVKKLAITQLPYLRSTDWAEIRRDALTNQDFFYSRRPGYYLGAFFGRRATDTVRSGPGFLWHPKAGIVVHGQQTNTGAWGTVPDGGVPDAANNLTAVYRVGERVWNGARAVPGTDKVRITYRNSTSAVVTDLTLDRNAVTRSVRATTAATEQIPLVLQPGDVVTWANGTASPYDTTTSANTTGITIKRGAATITVSWGTAHAATLSTSTRTYLRDGTKRVHILRVRHTGAIDVVITVN
jgi:hypothetical protein